MFHCRAYLYCWVIEPYYTTIWLFHYFICRRYWRLLAPFFLPIFSICYFFFFAFTLCALFSLLTPFISISWFADFRFLFDAIFASSYCLLYILPISFHDKPSIIALLLPYSDARLFSLFIIAAERLASPCLLVSLIICHDLPSRMPTFIIWVYALFTFDAFLRRWLFSSRAASPDWYTLRHYFYYDAAIFDTRVHCSLRHAIFFFRHALRRGFWDAKERDAAAVITTIFFASLHFCCHADGARDACRHAARLSVEATCHAFAASASWHAGLCRYFHTLSRHATACHAASASQRCFRHAAFDCLLMQIIIFWAARKSLALLIFFCWLSCRASAEARA